MALSVSITRDDVIPDGFLIRLNDEDGFSLGFIATERELGLIVDQILDVMGIPESASPYTIAHAPGSA